MIREVRETDNSKRVFNKLDKFYNDLVEKVLVKIINNPEIEKPMRNVRKGTRELYIKPFRLSYIYFVDKSLVYILDLYRKKKQ